MLIIPAIDLVQGQAVRLFRGDYAQMTIYDSDPLRVAQSFQSQGASCLHLVDLEGAKNGGTPNLEVFTRIVAETSLFTEVGGGIRSMEAVEAYLNAGVSRVILGTAAVTDEAFLQQAVAAWGSRIAVGVDIRDGYVSIKGWTEQTAYTCDRFFEKMQKLGIQTIICTDISRDGAMAGTNLDLYRQLSQAFRMDIVASGGVSSLADVKALRDMGLYGAIIGKAYYTGAIDLRQAIEVAS